MIFDCDGVLVDSEPISSAVLAAALSGAGLATTPAQARTEFTGMLLSEVAELADRRRGSPLPAEFWTTYEHDRDRAFERELTAVPGAADAVRHAKAIGLRVCVASQGARRKTELTLGVTGLRGLFEDRALFSADSVARGKPHPDLFLHAAETMGAAPGRCVVVEDSAIGITAAVAAGMRAVAYAGTGDADPLRAAGGTPIRSLAELAGLLAAEET